MIPRMIRAPAASATCDDSRRCVTSSRADQDSTQVVSDPVVDGLVKVADEIKLPAKEAGRLVQLAVKEGNLVRAGQVIGKIDDSEPVMQKKAAECRLRGRLQTLEGRRRNPLCQSPGRRRQSEL